MVLTPGQFAVEHVRPLGAGGLGTVDVVKVVQTNQAYPVGTLLARKQLGPKWAGDPGAQARFEREIEMMSAMNHPNIAPLRGASLPGGARWYVMPLYSGSVRSALQAGRRFQTVASVAGFGVRIADALSYAHSKNFSHRDLKPENILLNEHSEPVLADWGLGQFVHQHSLVLDMTRGGPMGTHYYCSFEQWTTGRSGVPGDVYSLGVTLAEFAAKRAIPINPPGAGHTVDVVPPLDQGSVRFNALIKRMTSFHPYNRHQSMAEVIHELRLCV